ncbi:hypothetical protein Poli38472_008515 [Pythium oligandrum]|uniref:oligopeptidase A n=1 Tax=Pythium oligandrum TaxID=41045 RepID=A0A8K1C3N4_PYTOL|nr:hypothetical protein Poli38472_008515 [Pythium oligandrum]|eukprot:TMW55867.1 hypothetical protein Poli38472_008515 [Pythium oligandrum]
MLRGALLRSAVRARAPSRFNRTALWKRFSSTASPLVECIRERTLPPFERLEIDQIPPAVKDAAADYTRDLRALEEQLKTALPSVKWGDVVNPLEVQSDPLERLWGVVGHLMSVRNSEELRQVHDELQQLVIQTFTETSQSKTLYDAYQAVRNSSEWESLSRAQKRVIELSLRSATLSGVGLEGEVKERFNKLKLRAAELSTKFSSNLLDATKAFSLIVTDKQQLSGLPDSLLQYFSQSAREDGHEDATSEAGPWRITLDPPSYVQFMKYAENRNLREQLHRASITRASGGEFDNEAIIKEILSIRKEMASILGFRTFAEVSIAKKMAPSVDEVEKMHEDLRAKCLDIAQEEIRVLSEYARQRGQQEPLALWDLAYWSEQLKAEKYLFTDEEIKPFFPLDKVLNGLFELTSKLFGVTIEAADGEVEVWNKDVRYFNVRSAEGDKEIIAGFYLDPYSRPKEKNGGAWMNVCVDRSRLLGRPEREGLRVPVAYLICNQSPPVGEKPSLMTFREVETLFHEFGHGLQHMLTNVDYSAVAGINGIEWDAVEIPSQMMENFCYDEATLQSISGHYETGAPLPKDLFEKIKAARNYMVATQMLRQLAFGALDMHLHHSYDGEEPLFEVQKRLLSRYSVLPPLDEDRFLCSFSHIFAGGYAAGYYSYKWAEILSCDAYGAFEEASKSSDSEDALKRVGRLFRSTVLGRGGGQHPLEVFEAFRGRKPSTVPLLTQYGLAK